MWAFQSSPALKSGCYIILEEALASYEGFNPHPP